MPFAQVACWEKDKLHQVIRPDAEAINDVIFSAIHSPQDIQLSRSEGDSTVVSPQQFLSEFTDPTREHVQAAIVGRSGAGKSHFIQWLRLQIPSDDECRVITIPKAGMSLRNILRLIINELPEAERQDYLSRLNQAEDDDLPTPIKRIRLLNSLGQVLSQEWVDADQSQLDATEAELLQLLPTLFADPDLRENWFLKDGSILARLVQHIYREEGSRDREEDLREFSTQDLPRDEAFTAGAASTTRQLLKVLPLPGVAETAVGIVNRCLQRAIAITLSFGGDSLIELLKDVRRHLKNQGKRLILLIEDLVRLQGIDHALLQALIIDARQGEGDLCQLRWAAAVTSGYYETLPATVRTRMDYIVTINARSAEISKEAQRQVLIKFTSKYLNAVRSGFDNLEHWFHSDPNASPPNKCNDCVYADECHTAFGAVEGVGLYPFTQRALAEMNARSNTVDEWFNPRRLLKKVLLTILDLNRESLVEGQFPSEQLLEVFGGAKMAPIEQERVVSRTAEPGRYLALLELWDGSGSLVKMPDTVVEAFALTQITDDIPGPQVEAGGVEEGGPEDEKTLGTDPKQDKTIIALRNWATGETMSDRMVNDMRGLVFSAIEDFINWDEVEIGKSFFWGQSAKPFNIRSINFKNQSLRVPSTEIALPIPFDGEDLNQAAVALEGLHLNKQHKSWDFDRGSYYLATVLECLRVWSESIVDQATSIVPRDSKWDVYQGALEILTVGALLSGRVKISSGYKASVVNEIVRPDYKHGSGLRSKELLSVAANITKKWELLTSFVRSYVSGTKGAREGAYISPEDILRIALRLKRNKWVMTLEMPEKPSKNRKFNEISELYRAIAEDLPEAIQQEQNSYKDWSELVEKQFGPDCSKGAIVNSLSDLRETVHNSRIPLRRANAFDTIVADFTACQFDNALRQTKPIAEKEAVESIARFARDGLRSPMNITKKLIETVVDVFEALESELSVRENDLSSSGGDELQTCQESITDCLKGLDDFFNEIVPGNGRDI